ncbi:eukaryotic translation initiation factor 4E transporter-like isoform X2 [Culicoides brevitarsis]|uniref:eukaryotic translation initiation factor 4E transporter-like isoform X2 n=1 Tax=Culicoides brevitarsis TaxID=469753 RepID=UPI00307C2C92
MSDTPSSSETPPGGIDDSLDNESSSASEKKDEPFQDPAILCQRRANSPPSFDRRYRYTHSELKALRDDPLCKRLPDCYDTRLVIWRRFGRGGEEEVDPRPSNGARERGEPRERRIYDNSSRGEMKRGSERGDKDPRERLKKEDNIILSPQRRSFNMGCQMPAAPASNTTPALGSSLLRNDRDIINSGRDRRIGSGRILARDVAWDYRPEKGDPADGDSYQNYRGNSSNTPASSNYRERDRDEKYESRRSSNNYDTPRDRRDYESSSSSREKDSFASRQFDRDRSERSERNSRYSSNNGRPSYNDRRRYSEKDEEPEWFSAGPTSQLETIDLHGFDDTLHEEKPESRKNGEKRSQKNETEEKSRNEAEIEEESRAESNNNPKANEVNNNKDRETDHKFDPPKNLLGEVLNNDDNDFNFDEFLNFDSISGLLSANQESSQANREPIGAGGSRFSQWFSRDSPTPKDSAKKGLFDSRRSSLHDELNNLIGDQMKAPGPAGAQGQESNKYFAPISPAANTARLRESFMEVMTGMKDGGNVRGNMTDRNLMFLMAQEAHQQKSSGLNSPSLSQMPSVEELEARLRGGEPSPPGRNVVNNKPNMPRMPQQQQMLDPETGVPVMQDAIAFKRLLAQMSDGMPPGPAQQMPNLQQIQQQQQANLIQMLSAKQAQNGQQNPEELKKMLNFMQQMQGANNGQMAPPHPQGRPIQGQKPPQPTPQDPLANMLHVNQMPATHLQPDLRNTEILQRPEAQLLIQSIIRGEMKPANLWQQMANPQTTPRQREMLTAVLNTFNSSPRVSSPNLLLPPPGGAPIPPLVPNGGLNPELQAQILLQQQKQQMRVSPLPNAFTVPPVAMATNNPLTLHVPGIPQRIPSPRELQFHTQSIMQNALIRKKLEEQRENFRKRQEAQQAQQAQNQPQTTPNPVTSAAPAPITPAQQASLASPVKHTQSPTPLAFTPTSVLRKMTAAAEKIGPEDANSASIVSSSAGSSALLNSIANAGNNKANPQQRMPPQNGPQLANQMANMQIGPQPIRGVSQRNPQGPSVPPQQQQMPGGGGNAAANMAWLQQQMQNQQNKPQGRPIVKQQASVPGQQQQPQANAAPNPQMMQQFNQPFDFNAAMQQQARKNAAANAPGNPIQGAGGNSALTAHQIQQLMAHRQQVQAAQVQQQQQKYLEMQRYRQMMEQQQNSQQQQQRPNAMPGSENPLGDRGIMNFGRDGNLSPTSNQLARWFSPELLAQASASKNNINLTQALSLEELERSMQHSSTPVHN